MSTKNVPLSPVSISAFACLCVARRQAPLREDVFPNNDNKESLTPYLFFSIEIVLLS